jgi:hypothetical protein
VKAKVGEKLHEELNYMAKVMPVNEYRASWLNEVLIDRQGSLLHGDCIPSDRTPIDLNTKHLKNDRILTKTEK